MIGEQKNDGYIAVATKVPPHVAQLLSILAQQRGMEVYELLQLLITGFITAAKHEGPLTPEMQLLIDSLKLDAAYNKAFNFSSPTACNEIAQMVLILQQAGHKGFGMVMIDRPFMGQATQTYSTDTIMERVTEVGMNTLYKKLRQIGVMMKAESIRETLTQLCDAQTIVELDRMNEEEMPGLGNYHDYGKQIEFGKAYKRKKHRTPDSLANSKQQHIIFDDNDRQSAQTEADDGHEDTGKDIGFRPFTDEW